MPWTAATCNTSSFNAKSMMHEMKEVSALLGHTPTRFIMTTDTLERMREELANKYPVNPEVVVDTFTGIPIEDHPTLKECLDRMMSPKDGERLQLIMDGKIPFDCISHPWVQAEAKKLADKYKIIDVGFA